MNDDIETMLADGWEIAGYSVYMMALGATGHNILLRKGTQLLAVTIGINDHEEVGRSVRVFSPKPTPPQRRGLFR